MGGGGTGQHGDRGDDAGTDRERGHAVPVVGLPPIIQPAIVGVKPASAKPNCVPMAMPLVRTLVGKYSAYVAGQTALGME